MNNNDSASHYKRLLDEEILRGKQLEEKLAGEERYYHSLLNGIQEEIVMIDRDYRITDVNKTFLETTGHSREEVIGRHCYEVSHGFNKPCDYFDEECCLNKVFETGGSYGCHHVHLLKDGGKANVDILLSPVKDKNGKVTQVIEAVRDVSETIYTYKVLRKKEALLEASEKLSKVGSWEYELATGEMTCADEVYRIIEIENVANIDLIQESMKCYRSEDREKIMGAFKAVIEKGESFDLEFSFTTFQGKSIWIKTNAMAIYEAGKITRIIGNVMDITDRKHSVERIEKVNQLKEKLMIVGGLNEKLRMITDNVLEIFNADFARIWVVDRGDMCNKNCLYGGNREAPCICRNRDYCLHQVSRSDRYTNNDEDVYQRVPFGCFKIGQVAAGEFQKYVTNDAANDLSINNHKWAEEMGLVSFAAYRLLSSDSKPLGIMALFSKRPILPNEDALLSNLANFAASVIESSKAEKERIRQADILQLTSDLVSSANMQGQVIYMNRAGRKLLGWAEDLNLKDTIIADIHPEWATDIIMNQGIPTALREGVWMGETAIFNLQGKEVPVSQVIMAHPTKEGTVEQMSTIMRDITERKQIEEALRRSERNLMALNEELENRVALRTNELEAANKELTRTIHDLRQTQAQLVESEKMAALGGLVAGVAHEINTPIGIVLTAASHLFETIELFQEQYKRGSIKRRDLEEFLDISRQSSSLVLSNLNRAITLIGSFKQVAVDQSVWERRVFNMRGYLSEILMSLHHRLKKKNLDININCPNDMLLDSYPGAYYQIISNLIMNALIHGFPDKKEGKIDIDITRINDKIQMEIKDNGLGIDSEAIKHIFEPFFTTRREQGGSGLGLHIVYNLVTQTLGGRIKCESEPGRGTRFLVEVPDTKEDKDEAG